MSAWFAAVGTPLSDAARADAQAYLDAFGFHGVGIAGVADWASAATLLKAPAGDHDWWAVEEAERQRLLAAAEDKDALLVALTEVATSVSDSAFAAVRGDPYLARVAAGAAMQAAYLNALARIAGAGPAHGFRIKHRLFAARRWPLGIADHTLRVF